MAWYGWLILAVILGGTAWVWHALYAGGGTGCVGCGRCIAEGRCVLRPGTEAKAGEKPRKPS